MSSDRLKTRVGINVVEKIISLKEQDKEFLTTKSLSVYLGGVSKDFIKDLRDSGVLIRFAKPYSIKSLMLRG